MCGSLECWRLVLHIEDQYWSWSNTTQEGTILRKYVRSGSKILSECWRAYKTVQQHGYIHYQVNHRWYFIHPQWGAHTQHIERSWRTYKENLYRYKRNLTKHSLRRNLCLIEWNYWLGKNHRHGPIACVIHDIKKVYTFKWKDTKLRIWL